MVTILALKRRTLAERRIIPLLRGESDPEAPPAVRRPIGELRGHALRNGLVILPAGSVYVGRDELALLGWLAGAQRVVAGTQAGPDDAELVETIRNCAGVLDANGLRLSALALYGTKDPRR